MVTAADLGPLVEEDVVPLLLGQCGGQIDPGPQQPQYKGGGDPVRQPDPGFALQGDRLGQGAPQTDQRQGAVPQQKGRARQPEDGGQGAPVGDLACLGDDRGGGSPRTLWEVRNALIGVAEEKVVHLPVQARQAGPDLDHLTLLPAIPGGWHKLSGGQKAEGALRRDGTQQAEEDHRPQKVGKPLGSPAQSQTDQQYGRNDEGGRSAHAQYSGEPSFHILTPCSRR